MASAGKLMQTLSGVLGTFMSDVEQRSDTMTRKQIAELTSLTRIKLKAILTTLDREAAVEAALSPAGKGRKTNGAPTTPRGGGNGGGAYGGGGGGGGGGNSSTIKGFATATNGEDSKGRLAVTRYVGAGGAAAQAREIELLKKANERGRKKTIGRKNGTSSSPTSSSSPSSSSSSYMPDRPASSTSGTRAGQEHRGDLAGTAGFGSHGHSIMSPRRTSTLVIPMAEQLMARQREEERRGRDEITGEIAHAGNGGNGGNGGKRSGDAFNNGCEADQYQHEQRSGNSVGTHPSQQLVVLTPSQRLRAEQQERDREMAMLRARVQNVLASSRQSAAVQFRRFNTIVRDNFVSAEEFCAGLRMLGCGRLDAGGVLTPEDLIEAFDMEHNEQVSV